MSDRKAVNRYYPPDFDPQKHKSINKYRNSHPLRERAKKLDQGILVIRFEMPYNIWCNGCGKHVGMGVRYNAEKKKVGKYYTTPIYQFKMKCHLCDNYYIIETDPQNCDYKIVDGARRKNQKWDMADNEQVLTEDREVIKKRSRDPMYKLEHGVEDTKKLKTVIPTLSQIADIQDAWKDDYIQNKMLRNKFREEKKLIKITEEKDQALLTKSSLDIALVPESEEDKKLASLMKYNAAESIEDKQKHKREEIKNRPLFGSSKPPSTIASITSSSSNDGGKKNLQDIQKRLGLDKVKGHSGFGKDFDSPINKRTSKSSSNLGLVVIKKKRKSSTNNDDVNHTTSHKIEQLKFETNNSVEDLMRTESQLRVSSTMHSLDSSSELRTSNVNTDYGKRTQDISRSESEDMQSPKTFSSVRTLETKSADSERGSLNSNAFSQPANSHVTTARPSILLCDYTSSSESD